MVLMVLEDSENNAGRQHSATSETWPKLSTVGLPPLK